MIMGWCNVLILSCRTAVDSILMKLLKLCRKDSLLSSYEGCRLRSISVVWFFLSLTLSLVTTKITYIIDFTGGLAAVFIFFFPGPVIIIVGSILYTRHILFSLQCHTILLIAIIIHISINSVQAWGWRYYTKPVLIIIIALVVFTYRKMHSVKV